MLISFANTHHNSTCKVFHLYINQNTHFLLSKDNINAGKYWLESYLCEHNMCCVYLNPEIRQPIADTETRVELEHPVREGTKPLSLKDPISWSRFWLDEDSERETEKERKRESVLYETSSDGMLRSQPYKLLHDSDASDSSSSSSSPTGSFSTPTCCSTSPTGSTSSPIVFCIHGNKWGVANCCEDIDQNSAEHEPMVGSNITHSFKHHQNRQIPSWHTLTNVSGRTVSICLKA